MDVGIILKIVGVGLLVCVACQVLSKSGREEQAAFVTLAGILAVLFFLIREVDSLLSAVREIFGL